MKLRLLCCLFMLFSAWQLASAQDQTNPSATAITPAEKPFVAPPEPPPPLFIFHIDGKTVEIDPDVNKIPVENLIDGDNVNSIQFISADEGMMRYGHKGRNGVIIVDFKEFAKLPEGLEVTDGR